MASDVASIPPNTTATESKSARKKKAKAEAAAPVPTSIPADTASQTPSNAADEGKLNGAEGNSENAYIKELQKNIRNVTKKLNATQKVDSIIAENPGVSLDDLVANRKINTDQKAQAVKKPGLQAQLAQFEEQLSHYKKFEQEFQQSNTKEKELLQSTYKKDIETLREQLKAEATAELKKNLKQKYLAFSQFLRQAAAKRQEEGPDSKERQAFEGILLLVYGGDTAAVDAIEKIVEGSEDIVNSVEDVPTGVTFAQIKKASIADDNPFSAERAWVDDVAQAQATDGQDATRTDPTIANAGLTELDTATAVVNGQGSSVDTPSAPAAGSVDAGAANAAAEEQWERAVASSEDPMGESFEIVPRDPQEVENAPVSAPNTSTQSWADDAAAAADPTPLVRETPAQTNNGDGFHEVHHNRGGRGRGGYHDRGSFRGRPRGDGRGRGGFRGRGDRGDRGGPRGGFRGNRGREAPSQ